VFPVKVIAGIESLGKPLEKSVVTIGNFDGVHLAHRALLDRVRAQADMDSIPAVVFTFDPHPLSVVAPERVPPELTPYAEKTRLIAECGVDLLVVARSHPALLNMEADEFLREVICRFFHPVQLIEGPTFGFGKGRKGTPQLLAALAPQLGFELHIVEAVTIQLDGGAAETVSSSLVRRLLTAGRVADAAKCLGRPYRLIGTVQTGDRRGRTLGFPTANLKIPRQMIPGDGVYAGMAHAEGAAVPCAISIGTNPTFHGGLRRVEAHLLEFDGDLYGQELSIDFTHWLRAQETFFSADELIRQLRLDTENVRDLFARTR